MDAHSLLIIVLSNSYWEKVFYLLAGHALADYVWQPEQMVWRKDPTTSPSETDKYGPWWWWMSAHALLNGCLVGLVLGRWQLGLAETALHFLTDTAKCTGRLSTNVDQALHLGSKLLWAWLA